MTKRAMEDISTLDLWDEAKLKAEWQIRADIKRLLVGWLYPFILQDEMIQIQKRQSELKLLGSA